MARAIRSLIAIFGAAIGASAAVPHSVHFRVFALRPPGELFCPADGAGKLYRIVCYPTARSPRYEFTGDMPLRFTDGTTTLVAAAAIPAEMSDALLLFLPAPSPINVSGTDAIAPPYQVAILDEAAFQRSTGLTIVNVSGLSLNGTVGTQAVVLRNGINPPLAAANSLSVVLRAVINARSYQSYAGTIDLHANPRALLILFPPYYPGSPEAQCRLLIDDLPPSRGPR